MKTWMLDDLYHHGIKGQKWGVRNGPPYPIERHYKRNKKKVDEIFNTMSKKERYYLTDDKNAKEYATEEMYSRKNRQASAYSDIMQIKDMPVAFFDIWTNPSDGDRVGEIAVGVNSNARGKGYGYKIAKRGVDWFESHPEVLDELFWGVHKDNEASRKLAEKLGFEQESSGKTENDDDWVGYSYKRKSKRR